MGRRKRLAATLSLLMVGATTLDPRIAFTRGSLATQFDASGRLTYCPNNLLLNSANMAAASWSYSSAASATTNTVTLSGGASYYGQPVIVPVGANGVIAAVLSGSGTVALRDANSGAKTVVTLTATPTLYYFTETFAASTGYLVLDNRTAYGADGAAKTVTVGGTYMSVVTYETAPRPQDQVITGASAYYGPRFDYGGFRTNLLPYSEATVAQLGLASGVTDAVSSIAGFGASIQFGDNTALRYAYRTYTTAAGSYAYSIFVQMDDGSVPTVGYSNSTGDFGVVFDGAQVVSGVTVVPQGASIYRITYTATSVGGALNFGLVKYTTQSGKAFRCTGRQLETGTVATPYIPTTSGPVTVGQPAGLLLECEPRVNRCTQSRNFAGAGWSSSGAPAPTTTTVGLNGQAGAFAWASSGTATGYYGFWGAAGSTQHTFSADVKLISGAATLRLGSDSAVWGTGSQLAYADFNPATQTFSNVTGGVSSYSAEYVADGWYRIQVQATTSAGGTNPSMIVYNMSATGGWISVDNVGFEAGGKASSRIFTNGATAPRAADVAFMSTAGWLNASQGTFAVEVDSSAIGSNYVGLFQVDNGASTDRIYAYVDQTTSKPSTQIKVGGTQTGGSGATSNIMTAGAVAKAAFTYSPSAATACLNGGAVSSGSVSALPVMTRLQLGNGDSALMGHIRRLSYYPRAITGSALQQLAA